MVAFFRFVAVLLPLAATFFSVSAQNLPACAQTCANSALSGTNCTALTDFRCVCNSEKFFTAAAACAFKSCNTTEIEEALAAIKLICAPYTTVSLTLPASLTSTLSFPTLTPGNGTTKGATSTHNVNATSTTTSPTGSGSSTTSAASTSRSGAAAPGAKVLFGSDPVLALVLGGAMFGAYVIGIIFEFGDKDDLKVFVKQ
ncbi:uncharacterized protein EI90DRAFT_3284831 [Cantharellus anzutake]|uniref:uncharacterized protein n=1 Tax=Cantharellus anzutake TaxID=1750568 RepID=UPI0019048E56|nr:uncharacterized protein EI90DRAFT_3284831 [Cantharellus anzutake]KAF8342688.1 hypothetical protein EI90DRAFT_3284831 [Cantharellus anzutake]